VVCSDVLWFAASLSVYSEPEQRSTTSVAAFSSDSDSDADSASVGVADLMPIAERLSESVRGAEQMDALREQLPALLSYIAADRVRAAGHYPVIGALVTRVIDDIDRRLIPSARSTAIVGIHRIRSALVRWVDRPLCAATTLLPLPLLLLLPRPPPSSRLRWTWTPVTAAMTANRQPLRA
jgi:hypothetical protein